jgi:hypothetical protein
MHCPFCEKTIAKRDSFCRYCGKAIPAEAKLPSAPPPWPQTTQPDEKDTGKILADAYTFLLGEKYMNMIATLYDLNPERALKIMQDDLSVKFGERPKKSREEIDKELEEFFNDPKTRKNVGK